MSWETGEIKVTQLGVNTSSIDGRDLQRGKTAIMSPESTLFILKGHFPHKVVFKRKSQPSEAPVEETRKSLNAAKADCSKVGLKRSSDTSNGVREDDTPPKKQKVSKSMDSKKLASEEELMEKSKHKKGSLKLSKKNSGDETIPGSKVTDYFACSKTSTSKDETDDSFDREEKGHGEWGNSSHRTETDLSSSRGDRRGQNKKDQLKGKKRSLSKTERESSSEASGKGTKRPLQDFSDEDSDEYVKVVSKKLEQLKQKAKKDNADHNAGASVLSKSTAGSGGEKRKSSTDSTTKSKMCKTGKPATESAWDLLDDKLCIFTSKGVAASEKVILYPLKALF